MIIQTLACGTFAVWLGLSPNQSATIETIAPPVRVERVVREGGWDVPGISTGTVFPPAVRLSGGQTELAITYHKPDQKAVFRVWSLRLADSGKEAHLDYHDVRIGLVSRYEKNGRPFCFVVNCYPQAFWPDGTRAGELGSIFFVSYYDLDGDGTFETMRGFDPRLGVDTPSWVEVPARQQKPK